MLALKTLYETNFHLWLKEIAQALRDRNLERLDRENRLEEIDAMGN